MEDDLERRKEDIEREKEEDRKLVARMNREENALTEQEIELEKKARWVISKDIYVFLWITLLHSNYFLLNDKTINEYNLFYLLLISVLLVYWMTTMYFGIPLSNIC